MDYSQGLGAVALVFTDRWQNADPLVLQFEFGNIWLVIGFTCTDNDTMDALHSNFSHFGSNRMPAVASQTIDAISDLDVLLVPILKLLEAEVPLPQRYNDYPLSGNWNNYRDCHIKPKLTPPQQRLAREIRAIGDTWRQIAKDLGIPHSTVSRWGEGRS